MPSSLPQQTVAAASRQAPWRSQPPVPCGPYAMTSPDDNRSWPDHQPEQQREQAQQGRQHDDAEGHHDHHRRQHESADQPGWEQ